MLLFVTPNSPYARIARIAVVEAGLSNRIEERQAKLRHAENPILSYCPLGRVPTLVAGDLVLGQARAICAYLDHLAGTQRFFPDSSWQARALESLTTGFIDGVAVWVRELRRPEEEQSKPLIEVDRVRTGRCLDRLEAEVESGRIAGAWGFAEIQLACTLGIMSHSLTSLDWRQECPALSAWFDRQGERPAMISTAPLAKG